MHCLDAVTESIDQAVKCKALLCATKSNVSICLMIPDTLIKDVFFNVSKIFKNAAFIVNIPSFV